MDMDGWLYFRGQREILIWDDLTIQQHDPRCVSGSQQRLTPGVGAHNLIGESAAERLGLPWLHIQACANRQTHADIHRDTDIRINIYLLWQNIKKTLRHHT